MCICIYVYMYMCICVYVYMCICVYVYMCICVYVDVDVYMYIYIYTYLNNHTIFVEPCHKSKNSRPGDRDADGMAEAGQGVGMFIS